jgi:hypothetical protein
MRLVTRRGLMALGIVALAAGCGAAHEQMLSASDLRRMTTVRPMPPGWNWPQRPTHEKQITGPCDGWRWQDAEKLGVTYACLVDSETGAHKDVEPERSHATGRSARSMEGTSRTFRSTGSAMRRGGSRATSPEGKRSRMGGGGAGSCCKSTSSASFRPAHPTSAGRGAPGRTRSTRRHVRAERDRRRGGGRAPSRPARTSNRGLRLQ